MFRDNRNNKGLTMLTFEIYKGLEYLGTVDAGNADEAVQEAWGVFGTCDVRAELRW